MDSQNPTSCGFLIKWKNRLDIGDSKIYILRNDKQGYKEIVISFKVIFINTYNVVVMDISNEGK